MEEILMTRGFWLLTQFGDNEHANDTYKQIHIQRGIINTLRCQFRITSYADYYVAYTVDRSVGPREI